MEGRAPWMQGRGQLQGINNKVACEDNCGERHCGQSKVGRTTLLGLMKMGKTSPVEMCARSDYFGHHLVWNVLWDLFSNMHVIVTMNTVLNSWLPWIPIGML